jgi:hypothetical protein
MERRGAAGSGPSSTSGRSSAEWRLRRGGCSGEGWAGREAGARTLLRARKASRGVSLWKRPLRRRTWPGVLFAFARSLCARIACGVVGAARRAGSGRVAGPPRGVRLVPGVRFVLLPGVAPTLAARRNGVTGFGAILASRCNWQDQQGAMVEDKIAYVGVNGRGIGVVLVRCARAEALLFPCRFRHGGLQVGEQSRVHVVAPNPRLRC